MATIPYFAHEGEMARMERASRRWFAAFLIVLVLFAGSNLAWIIYENQFENISIYQNADADNGGDNYINGTGDFNYGTRESDN